MHWDPIEPLLCRHPVLLGMGVSAAAKLVGTRAALGAGDSTACLCVQLRQARSRERCEQHVRHSKEYAESTARVAAARRLADADASGSRFRTKVARG